MFRFIELEVPANTPASAKATKVLELRDGIIRNWYIGFPHGCFNRVKAQVFQFEHQILPQSEGEYLYWSGFIFVIPDEYVLEDEPYEVELRAFNTDTTNPHTIFLGVDLEEIAEETTESLLQRLLEVFGVG